MMIKNLQYRFKNSPMAVDEHFDDCTDDVEVELTAKINL